MSAACRTCGRATLVLFRLTACALAAIHPHPSSTGKALDAAAHVAAVCARVRGVDGAWLLRPVQERSAFQIPRHPRLHARIVPV